MEYDTYDIGFANGLGILGGHWYSDPYNLYSDWKIDRNYEASLVNNNFINYGVFFTYVVYPNNDPIPNPDPIPVPEPSSFCLLISGFVAVFVFRRLFGT